MTLSPMYRHILMCTLFYTINLTMASDHQHRHRHQLHPASSGKQWRSVAYPNEVCRDRRYWKQLPNPDGVIGYGYNTATGRPTTLILFDRATYDEGECLLAGRRSKTGIWDMHRLPSYLMKYTFYEESENAMSKVNFEYTVYNSTLEALLDAKRSRSTPFEMNETTKYEDTYIYRKWTPIRPYPGTKTYYEAMQELAASISKSSELAAPVLYSLRATLVTGEFEMKPKEELSWRHLNEKFINRSREAILRDGFSERYFEEVGTHYAKGGTFGGISERWWITRRRPERKCAEGEESKILDASVMAACDRLKLGDSNGGKINENKDRAIATSDRDRCHLVFDDEKFRASHWMVTAGGPLDRLKQAHIGQVAFSGLSVSGQLEQWVESLNDEPSTVRVDLHPICDLLPLIDPRPWHIERCKDQLVNYLLEKDPFYAGKSETGCPSGEVAVKFDKSSSARGGPLSEMRGESNWNWTGMSQVYCVPASPYVPERTCKANAGAPGHHAPPCVWWALRLLCFFVILRGKDGKMG